MLKNLFSKIRPTQAEPPPSAPSDPEVATSEPPIASQASSPIDVEPPTDPASDSVSVAVETPTIEATDAPASLLRAGEDRDPTLEEVSALAYTIWKERGMPQGSDREDWIEAERQLRESRSHPS